MKFFRVGSIYKKIARENKKYIYITAPHMLEYIRR